MPVGLRTNSMAVGTPGGKDAGVVTGAGGQHRAGRRGAAASRSRKAGSKRTIGSERLLAHGEGDAVSVGQLLGGLTISVDDARRRVSLVGGAGVQPGSDRD